MSIKHYGLDEAEIEHLKAANLTDEEINALNKKRVQEQMDEESENVDDGTGVNPEYPHVPPALLDFIISFDAGKLNAKIAENWFKNKHPEFAKEHPELMPNDLIISKRAADELKNDKSLSDPRAKEEFIQNIQLGGILGSLIDDIPLDPQSKKELIDDRVIISDYI